MAARATFILVFDDENKKAKRFGSMDVKWHVKNLLCPTTTFMTQIPRFERHITMLYTFCIEFRIFDLSDQSNKNNFFE